MLESIFGFVCSKCFDTTIPSVSFYEQLFVTSVWVWLSSSYNTYSAPWLDDKTSLNKDSLLASLQQTQYRLSPFVCDVCIHMKSLDVRFVQSPSSQSSSQPTVLFLLNVREETQAVGKTRHDPSDENIPTLLQFCHFRQSLEGALPSYCWMEVVCFDRPASENQNLLSSAVLCSFRDFIKHTWPLSSLATEQLVLAMLWRDPSVVLTLVLIEASRDSIYCLSQHFILHYCFEWMLKPKIKKSGLKSSMLSATAEASCWLLAGFSVFWGGKG